MTNYQDDHDFQQFGGRFEQSISPSPAFASSLKERLSLGTTFGNVEVSPGEVVDQRSTSLESTAFDEAEDRP